MNLEDLRGAYCPVEDSFDVTSLVPSKDPFDQFGAWLKDAMNCSRSVIGEPNAMALATCDSTTLQPAARMVLLKQFDNHGFVFFTNYLSRKGQDLASNAKASLLFYWEPLHRQIRIEGRCEMVSAKESDAYWNHRPFESQVSASAFTQGTVLPDKKTLTDRCEMLLQKSSEEANSTSPPRLIPRPSEWGGYRLVPNVFEFWQGHTNRAHDRLRFRQTTQSGNGETWIIERLAP